MESEEEADEENDDDEVPLLSLLELSVVEELVAPKVVVKNGNPLPLLARVVSLIIEVLPMFVERRVFVARELLDVAIIVEFPRSARPELVVFVPSGTE